MVALSKNQQRMMDLILKASSVYTEFYLNRPENKQQFKGNFSALTNFLDSYAFVRAGPSEVYSSIGVTAVRDVISGEFDDIRDNWPDDVWNSCKDIRDQRHIQKLNDSLFPLNPTISESGKTSILSLMHSGEIGTNIAIWCRDMIASGRTREAFDSLRMIRGVGDKIASLYLRDIAYLSMDKDGLEKIAAPDLLQPIDTWVSRTTEIFAGEKKTVSKARKYAVNMCPSVLASVKFNMGAWVLGAEVAGDVNILKSILEGDHSRIREKADMLERRSNAYRKLVGDLAS